MVITILTLVIIISMLCGVLLGRIKGWRKMHNTLNELCFDITLIELEKFILTNTERYHRLLEQQICEKRWKLIFSRKSFSIIETALRDQIISIHKETLKNSEKERYLENISTFI